MRISRVKATLLSSSLVLALPAGAIDGSNDIFVTVPSGVPALGWKTFEIISGNDTLGSIAKEGFVWTTKHKDWDGLGAYLHDPNTLRIFINHEERTNSTFSRVDLDVLNLENWIASGIPNNTPTNQVAAPGPVVTAVSRGWLTLGSGTDPVDNPCSGNVWLADTFGPGRGFAESLYLLGEEARNPTSGYFWVMDLATRTVYEAVDLGIGIWENATIIDTGRTDTVALLLSEDAGAHAFGTAPLRLYVGQKNPAGNFLARNGLVGGSVYHWDPDGTTSTNGTMSGIFSAGAGASVTGTWVSSSTGAANISKSEDIHTNVNPLSPGYGVEAILASQEEGIFKIDCSSLDFVAGNLGANRTSNISVIYESATQPGSNVFEGMDNLVWAADGMLYVNEDDDDGDIWLVDIASLEADHAISDFTPNSSQIVNILDADFIGQESSGIIEISYSVGYQAGSIFLTTGLSSSGVQYNQVALLVSPSATLKNYNLTYTAETGGSITGLDSQSIPHRTNGTEVTAAPSSGYGFLVWNDGVTSANRTEIALIKDFSASAHFVPASYLTWTSNFPGIAGLDLLPEADPDQDGLSNYLEYCCNLSPSIPDLSPLAPGSGTSGLPIIEARPFNTTTRLVIEYVRRIDDPTILYTPQFSSTLDSISWATGGTESASPIDSSYERVIQFDTVNIDDTETRFSRLKISGDSMP